jgi:hypothetical protein
VSIADCRLASILGAHLPQRHQRFSGSAPQRNQQLRPLSALIVLSAISGSAAPIPLVPLLGEGEISL